MTLVPSRAAEWSTSAERFDELALSADPGDRTDLERVARLCRTMARRCNAHGAGSCLVCGKPVEGHSARCPGAFM